jgi:hypothetical protein
LRVERVRFLKGFVTFQEIVSSTERRGEEKEGDKV